MVVIIFPHNNKQLYFLINYRYSYYGTILQVVSGEEVLCIIYAY